MIALNTKRIITATAKAEIKRLLAKKAKLEERKRVLEELIREQDAKANQTTESQ
jgi:hypothetical protein